MGVAALLAPGLRHHHVWRGRAGELYVASQKTGAVYRIEGSLAPRFGAAAVTNPRASRVAWWRVRSRPRSRPGCATARRSAGRSGTAARQRRRRLGDGGRNRGAGVLGEQRERPGAGELSGAVELAGRASATVVIARDGNASAPVDVPVSVTQPAVYTANGQAIVVRAADYTLRAPKGEYVFVYASGVVRHRESASGRRGRPRISARKHERDRACHARWAGLRRAIRGTRSGLRRGVPGEFPACPREWRAGRRIW